MTRLRKLARRGRLSDVHVYVQGHAGPCQWTHLLDLDCSRPFNILSQRRTHHDRFPRRSATTGSGRLDHRAVHTRRTTSYPSAVVRAATLCSSKRTPEERLGPIGANEVSDRSYCGLCTPADVLGLGLAAGADTWFGECAQDTVGHT